MSLRRRGRDERESTPLRRWRAAENARTAVLRRKKEAARLDALAKAADYGSPFEGAKIAGADELGDEEAARAAGVAVASPGSPGSPGGSGDSGDDAASQDDGGDDLGKFAKAKGGAKRSAKLWTASQSAVRAQLEREKAEAEAAKHRLAALLEVVEDKPGPEQSVLLQRRPPRRQLRGTGSEEHARDIVNRFPALFRSSAMKAPPVMGCPEWHGKYDSTLLVWLERPGRLRLPGSDAASWGSCSLEGMPRHLRRDNPALGYGTRYVDPVTGVKPYQMVEPIEPLTPRSELSNFSRVSEHSYEACGPADGADPLGNAIGDGLVQRGRPGLFSGSTASLSGGRPRLFSGSAASLAGGRPHEQVVPRDLAAALRLDRDGDVDEWAAAQAGLRPAPLLRGYSRSGDVAFALRSGSAGGMTSSSGDWGRDGPDPPQGDVPTTPVSAGGRSRLSSFGSSAFPPSPGMGSSRSGGRSIGAAREHTAAILSRLPPTAPAAGPGSVMSGGSGNDRRLTSHSIDSNAGSRRARSHSELSGHRPGSAASTVQRFRGATSQRLELASGQLMFSNPPPRDHMDDIADGTVHDQPAHARPGDDDVGSDSASDLLASDRSLRAAQLRAMPGEAGDRAREEAMRDELDSRSTGSRGALRSAGSFYVRVQKDDGAKFDFGASPFSKAAKASFDRVFGQRGLAGVGPKRGGHENMNLMDGYQGSSGGALAPLYDIEAELEPDEKVRKHEVELALKDALELMQRNQPRKVIAEVRCHFERSFCFVRFHTPAEAELALVLINAAVAEANKFGQRHKVFRRAFYI